MRTHSGIRSGISFELAVGLTPLPSLAQLQGDITAPLAVVALDGLVDKRDVTGGQIPAPVLEGNAVWTAFRVHDNPIAESCS